MKRKRGDQQEKRRPLAEINLASQGRPRVQISRKGCLPFTLFAFTAAGALLAAVPMVH